MNVEKDYQRSVSEAEKDGFQLLGKVLSYICPSEGEFYSNLEWYLLGKQFGNMIILMIAGYDGQLFNVTHVGSRRIRAFDSDADDFVMVEVDSMFEPRKGMTMYFKRPF